LQFPEIGALESTAPGEPRGDPDRNIDLLRDVALRVKVELGRGKMLLRDVLRLTEGSVVELEKLAGDPLEIYVNDRLVGKGEVLVLNENFCIRITQIFSPEECLRLKGSA
jgi:flagellar motor switch protein FliN/FliY